MKRKEQSLLLAGLLALGLAGCTTDRMRSSDTASTTSDQSPTGISYGTQSPRETVTGQSTSGTAGTASTAAGTAAATMDQQTAPAQASTATGMPAAPPNSVVTMIEVVPRSDDATGAGTMAGAAVGGTVAGTAERVYRVTLRMDDGSTRVVTQEWAPTFRSGDRVNLSGGEIQRR
ncbi:hypothetical protein HHL21_17785 [Massilia sp. RP-1-19]|uniref:Uncharacterized protein n=1 Tax=Massilia polaris TaxID=2728846 RepID=A0A848HNG5_9BURK|nr:hypothetical protein [Massilia polaris]NML62895.1 hypothetical protein [Massilia polaris]